MCGVDVIAKEGLLVGRCEEAGGAGIGMGDVPTASFWTSSAKYCLCREMSNSMRCYEHMSIS